MNSWQEPKPNWWLSQLLESKGTFFEFKVYVQKWSILLSSEFSSILQEVEKGKHKNKKCESYCNEYKRVFGQELPDCQFKGNNSKIQNLIRKIHIDEDGSVAEVQFNNLAYEESESELESESESVEVTDTTKSWNLQWWGCHRHIFWQQILDKAESESKIVQEILSSLAIKDLKNFLESKN